MAAHATEIVSFPISDDSLICDPSSPAGKQAQEVKETLAAQEGFQRAYWGYYVENPRMMQLMIGRHSLIHSNYIYYLSSVTQRVEHFL